VGPHQVFGKVAWSKLTITLHVMLDWRISTQHKNIRGNLSWKAWSFVQLRKQIELVQPKNYLLLLSLSLSSFTSFLSLSLAHTHTLSLSYTHTLNLLSLSFSGIHTCTHSFSLAISSYSYSLSHSSISLTHSRSLPLSVRIANFIFVLSFSFPGNSNYVTQTNLLLSADKFSLIFYKRASSASFLSRVN